MITRRNWLLRCSLLVNIAVLLYVCSQEMIGGGNFTLTPAAYIISEELPKAGQFQQPLVSSSISSSTSGKGQMTGGAPGAGVGVGNAVGSGASGGVGGAAGGSGGATLTQKQITVDTNTLNNIKKDEQEQLQLELMQSKQQAIMASKFEEVDNEEKRFEIPTEMPSNNAGIGGFGNSAAGGGGAGGSSNGANAINTKNLNDIVYSETNNGMITNNTMNCDSYVTSASFDLDTRLKTLLNCHDKDYDPYTIQRGDFWVLRNYVRADHGPLRCYETITYTTHADYTFLDNLVPLLERWNAPVSIALHAPGTDFVPTLNAIKYLRDCLPESHLVRQFVTFHIYFSSKHIPKIVPKYDRALMPPYNCTIQPPFFNVSASQLYKTQKKLLYPVNVGRNIARDAAMTHFILASDIELYPNPGLVHKFLEMIARNDPPLQRKNPRVFPLSIFEVDSSSPVPRDKTELQELLRNGKAIPFHKRVCSSCHGVPKSKEWMSANETDDLGIFHIGKRIGYFVHWEPIYIGTHFDPHYDERLSWEGKSDKMTQGYALCVLDYEFQILDNAFLVHKPGIKIYKKDPKRDMLAAKTNQLIKKIIYPELQVMYGMRKGCAV